ncbi:MAG: ice-binding family protein [Cyclobacteriaceae bacterium]
MLPIILLTSCDKDNTDDPNPTDSPTVTANFPVLNATDVAINVAPEFTFSVAMNPITINTTTVTLMRGTTKIAGAVTYSNNTAKLTPTAVLAFNTAYTASVSIDALSATGATLESAYSFNFTTSIEVDGTAPIINTKAPLDDATDVPRNKTITVEFNEAMDPATINSTTFTLKQGTSVVTGVVAYAGTTATFTPSQNLDANKIYTAAITTSAKDLTGNPLAANTTWTFTTGGSSAVLATVDLGVSGNYVILAKTAINNSATSAITGHLGLSPAATSYITGLSLVDFTGYATSAQVTGNIYAADMAVPTPVTLTTAVSNMITAYNDAAGRPSPDFLELGTGNIGGKTLSAGLYKWTNTVTIPADLTLTGGADDIWIFQIAGDLTQSAAVKITLNGGAQAKNIFWQVAGEATFGTTSHFEGIILSMTAITFQTNASMNGRALSQTAVILDSNIITQVQ